MIGAFMVIAAMLALTNGIVVREQRRVAATVNLLVDHVTRSLELVARIGGGVYRWRLLIDAHIFETSPADIANRDAQIVAIVVDYEAAARAYQPLTQFPGEADTWGRLQGNVATLRPSVATALAFSRQNRDAEAREILLGNESLFNAVETDVNDLVRINHDGADEAKESVESILGSSSALLSGLSLIEVFLTLFVGFWAVRLVHRREDEQRRYALLLETRNRDLDAFAGRVAHDLRGPLTAIGLAGTSLSHQVSGESPAAAVLERAVARMEAMIEDLLALSRIDGAVLQGVGDPARVAAQIQEELESRPDGRNVRLRLSVEPAKVRCAEGLLRQVLANLVDNAGKYRRAGVEPTIEISGGIVGQEYELRVSDNGVGMSSEEARQSFDPLYRALRVPGQQGTGLGLSIVKRVVEASGGTVRVLSELGSGTTFVVRLALAGDERREQGREQSRQRSSGENLTQ